MCDEILTIQQEKCHATGDGILPGESGYEPHCEPLFTAICIQCKSDDGASYLIRQRASTRYVWIL
jgi:hypothetical protein